MWDTESGSGALKRGGQVELPELSGGGRYDGRLCRWVPLSSPLGAAHCGGLGGESSPARISQFVHGAYGAEAVRSQSS